MALSQYMNLRHSFRGGLEAATLAARDRPSGMPWMCLKISMVLLLMKWACMLHRASLLLCTCVFGDIPSGNVNHKRHTESQMRLWSHFVGTGYS